MRDNYERLRGEWSYLQGTWKNTRQHWQDGMAEHFEQRFWSNWEREVPRTLAKVQKLEEVLRRIRTNSSRYR